MKQEENSYKITDLVIRDSENLKISSPFPYLYENASGQLNGNYGFMIFAKLKLPYRNFIQKTVNKWK